jgi:hypothetical protein
MSEPRSRYDGYSQVNGRSKQQATFSLTHHIFSCTHTVRFGTSGDTLLLRLGKHFAVRADRTATMPFPYYDDLPAEFMVTWTSPRNRKATTPAVASSAPPAKCKASASPCPHSMTVVRASRQLAAEKKQCPICLEDYFSTPARSEKARTSSAEAASTSTGLSASSVLWDGARRCHCSRNIASCAQPGNATMH